MSIGEFFEMAWAIIIIVAAVSVSSAKKKAKERQRHFQPQPATVSPQPAAPKATTPAPAQMLPPLPKAAPVKSAPLRPTVHVHVDPDCDTHDVPGSLGVTSLEGKDFCHQEQMEDLTRTSFAAAREESGLTLDWSGENMVKAFVMQEVLKRPCERARH